MTEVEGIVMERRLRDFVKEVPSEQVPTFLAQKVDEIAATFLRRIKNEKERTDENLLYFRCLAKACELLDNFSQAWLNNLLVGCVTTRAMFELNLLIRWFEDEPKTRLKFYYSALWEERDVIDAFLKLDETRQKGEPLRERLEQLKAFEKKYQLNRQRDAIERVQWKKLAERFRLEKDYNTIYSLASKILHISPYSVLRDITKEDYEHVWKIFLVMIQLFLGDTYFRIARFLGVNIK